MVYFEKWPGRRESARRRETKNREKETEHTWTELEPSESSGTPENKSIKVLHSSKAG